MPNLPVTVDYDFYQAMSKAVSVEFADSYLSGAELYRGVLLPRTHIAWERLKDSTAAMGVINRHRVKLKEPPYFTADAMTQLQGRGA